MEDLASARQTFVATTDVTRLSFARLIV